MKYDQDVFHCQLSYLLAFLTIFSFRCCWDYTISVNAPLLLPLSYSNSLPSTLFTLKYSLWTFIDHKTHSFANNRQNLPVSFSWGIHLFIPEKPIHHSPLSKYAYSLGAGAKHYCFNVAVCHHLSEISIQRVMMRGKKSSVRQLTCFLICLFEVAYRLSLAPRLGPHHSTDLQRTLSDG